MKINFHPSTVVSYFLRHQYELPYESLKIADDDETGISIYMSATQNGERPIVSVYKNGREVCTRYVLHASELDSVVKGLYEKFLPENPTWFKSSEDTSLPSAVKPDSKEKEISTGEEDDDELLDEEEMIYQRETELDDAVYDFMSTVADDDIDVITDEKLQEIKERLLQVIYEEFGCEIYRPMYLQYGDDEPEFLEYPYGDIDFEE